MKNFAVITVQAGTFIKKSTDSFPGDRVEQKRDSDCVAVGMWLGAVITAMVIAILSHFKIL